MDDSRPRANPPLIAIAVFCMLVAAYFAGYFWRCKVGMVGPNRVRTYPSRIEAELFSPFAAIESMWDGRPVYVGHSP
jgi:hypothetical protein